MVFTFETLPAYELTGLILASYPKLQILFAEFLSCQKGGTVEMGVQVVPPHIVKTIFLLEMFRFMHKGHTQCLRASFGYEN